MLEADSVRDIRVMVLRLLLETGVEFRMDWKCKLVVIKITDENYNR